MDKLTREKKLEIVKFLENCEDNLYDLINAGDIESFENDCWMWSGDLYGFLNGFVESLGTILGIDLSLDTTRSIEDILCLIKTNSNIHDIEELEEVDTWIDNSDLIFVNVHIIMKYKPTGEHYHFIEQRTGDVYIKSKKIIYKGKVERKEIKTFSWELVEKEKQEQADGNN